MRECVCEIATIGEVAEGMGAVRKVLGMNFFCLLQ